MSKPTRKPTKPIDAYVAVLLTLCWFFAVTTLARSWVGAVMDQWAASYDGDAAGMARHAELSRDAEGWNLRMAAALVGGPAIIALAAAVRRSSRLAIGYGIAAAVMAIPAALLALYSLDL